MASIIDIETNEQGKMCPKDWTPCILLRTDTSDWCYIIAKGNIIEGIEAKE